jgi:hypothetical protein
LSRPPPPLLLLLLLLLLLPLLPLLLLLLPLLPLLLLLLGAPPLPRAKLRLTAEEFPPGRAAGMRGSRPPMFLPLALTTCSNLARSKSSRPSCRATLACAPNANATCRSIAGHGRRGYA